MSWKEVLKATEKDERESFEKKGSKPDYIDLDGDGDKKESMKQAAKDKKRKAEEAHLHQRIDSMSWRDVVLKFDEREVAVVFKRRLLSQMSTNGN